MRRLRGSRARKRARAAAAPPCPHAEWCALAELYGEPLPVCLAATHANAALGIDVERELETAGLS